ncbi:MAG: hypothetical protein ISR65_19905 [Bacteriovoracaceae bacterium]|nr:hypothetical protein [Bacteriovoracaceae bacterium]
MKPRGNIRLYHPIDYAKEVHSEVVKAFSPATTYSRIQDGIQITLINFGH